MTLKGLNEENYSKTELLAQCFENTLHDIKTPISIIYMHIQSLAQDPEFPAKLIGSADIISKYCRKIMNLLYESADYGKLLHGRFVPRLALHDVVGALKSLVRSVTVLADKKNISVSFNSDVEEKYILTDKVILERIFINILSNSIKFTPKDGTVSVNARCGESVVTVEIADSGTGFGKGELPNVFERYTAFGAGSDVSGSGIGLSIAREMVLAMGGSIVAKNRDSGGALVTVELPELTEGVSKEEYLSQSSGEFDEMTQTALAEEHY